MVWECDPGGRARAQGAAGAGRLPARGGRRGPGRRTRVPDRGRARRRLLPVHATSYPDLASGLLEVAVVRRTAVVTWRAVPEPPTTARLEPPRASRSAKDRVQRRQGALVRAAACCYFTTKGDMRVWSRRCPRRRGSRCIFDRASTPESSLDAVDNVTVTAVGEDLRLRGQRATWRSGSIAPAPDPVVSPFLRFVGDRSQRPPKVCGAVFDPSGTRLYLTYPKHVRHSRRQHSRRADLRGERIHSSSPLPGRPPQRLPSARPRSERAQAARARSHRPRVRVRRRRAQDCSSTSLLHRASSS